MLTHVTLRQFDTCSAYLFDMWSYFLEAFAFSYPTPETWMRWFKEFSLHLPFRDKGFVSCGFLRCSLYCGIFGERITIECWEVWKGNQVMFGPLLDSMFLFEFLFEFQFQRFCHYLIANFLPNCRVFLEHPPLCELACLDACAFFHRESLFLIIYIYCLLHTYGTIINTMNVR